MYNIYFKQAEHSTVVSTVETSREAMKFIAQYLTDREFKSYYSRFWATKKEDEKCYLTIDFGSHSAFFEIGPFDSIEAATSFGIAGYQTAS